MIKLSKSTITAAAIATLVLLVGAAYLLTHYDVLALNETTATAIGQNTPAPLFIVLMIILPIFGVPISIFLVLAGIKFGAAGGLALVAVVMPIHFLTAYFLVKFAREPVEKFLNRFHYKIPQVPPSKQIRYCFLLVALPGLPYAVKNYLPPIVGVPFGPYFLMNLACQYLGCLPMVVMGGALTEMNFKLIVVGIAIFAVLYLLISYLEKKYSDQVAAPEA